MKRTVPLLITTVGGIVLIASFFVPAAESWGEVATTWFNILAAIAFVLGGGNLLKVHLKAIADRVAGWGYSAVILASFLLTLLLGLFKVGVRPDVSQQYPGETWVPIDAAALPTFPLPLAEPPDGWPMSLRAFVEPNPKAAQFRGYLSPEQTVDLLATTDDPAVKCAIETFAQTASLPAGVQPFLRYRPRHRALAAIGPLLSVQAKAADAVVPESDPRYPAWHDAIVELKDASRLETTVVVPPAAEVLAWPGELFPVYIEADADGTRRMTALGPLTESNRETLLAAGGLSRPSVPLDETTVDGRIASLGTLSDGQRELARRRLAQPWTAIELLDFVNARTAATTRPRDWCDIAADASDDPPLTEPDQPALTLSDEQAAAITTVVEAGGVTLDQLLDTGLAPRQAAAIRQFLATQPTEADRDRDLALDLLRLGPVDADAVDGLLAPFRSRRAWRQAVAALDQQSQRVKFPWAAAYNREGSAFWWIYEYLFRPLTATMFAMLAFYISSAAFRAFRAKNLDASLLLGTALIVLLGRISLGYVLTDFIDPAGPLAFLRLEVLTEGWIMKVFATAGNRAIMIGIALGTVSTSLKILLGIDRSYLGGD